MKTPRWLPSLLLAMPLAAQSPEVSGFERELRTQRVAMLVVVTDAKGEWAKSLEKLRKEDAFIDLDLWLSLRSKPEVITHLQDRYGLGPKPYWAVFAQGRMVASGRQPPSAAELKSLRDQAAWPSPEEVYRRFLRENPDHRDARLRLLGILYSKAEWRTRVAMGLYTQPLEASDLGWDPVKYEKQEEERAERKKREDEEAKPPKLLEPEEDERIWGAFADEWTKAVRAEEWREWGGSSFRADAMRHSPRMKAAFRELVPQIETSLHQWPARWNYWQLWLQASEVLGGLPLRRVLDDLTPEPLNAPDQWPPFAVRNEYLRDCRKRKDWAAVKDLLLPQWENERLWKGRETVRYVALKDGKELPDSWDSSKWRDTTEPLVEALLRLGDTAKADEIVRIVISESLVRDLASKASALAATCGQPALALNWAALQPGKAR